MTEALNEELYKSYKYIKILLRDFSASHHLPNQYITSLLTELVTLTRTTITMLHQETVAKRRLRQAISTLYRSYYFFEIAFHEWVRNAKLQEPANLHVILQREVTARFIERHIRSAIPEMAKMYSSYELRGMVPNRYREGINFYI